MLLVEDDLVLRNCLSRMLEKNGWVPEGVASMEEAVEILSQKDFSLVVTDYQLETSRTGLSLLAYLGKIGSRTPSILMSASKSPRLGNAARGLGAFAFLEKPFGMRSFLDLCGQALLADSVQGAGFQEGKLSESVL